MFNTFPSLLAEGGLLGGKTGYENIANMIYRLETDVTLTAFTNMPGPTFTATGFSEQRNITLGTNCDFVRAQRD